MAGESGVLSSMGHPGSYSNGAHCQWHIKVPDGKLVHLHFHNFSLEDTQLCLNDKVTINDSLASLGTYCSHIPPQDLVSIGDRLSLYFTSNNKVVDTGFRASWKAVDPWLVRTAPGPPQESLVRDETRISLPAKPSLTRTTLGQLYVAPRTSQSRLAVTEPGREPRVSGGTASAAMQFPRPLRHLGGQPNILMDLHKVFTHRLSLPSSLLLPPTASCGGVFSSEQGELTSPNWPNNYLDQAVCTWRISIPSALNIHIVFTHLEVQAVNQLGQCVDYVEIYGGAGLTSQDRFCGFAPPAEVTVVGNTAVVRFLSNKANVEKGFRGYWTTDPNLFPTLPPPPGNPWDKITISWPEMCGSPAG